MCTLCDTGTPELTRRLQEVRKEAKKYGEERKQDTIIFFTGTEYGFCTADWFYGCNTAGRYIDTITYFTPHAEVNAV